MSRYRVDRSSRRSSSSWSLLVIVLLFRASWRVAEPDEALIISGFRIERASATGGRAWASASSPVAARCHARRHQGPHPLARGARERDRRARASASRRSALDLRGVVVYKVGDDYRVDRQRRPTLPRPARRGARVEGPERVRRPPARDRRLDDRRGHDQRPGQVRPAGARSLQPGDGVVRPGHRQLPDPGDHEPVQLHREPRRAAPGRGRAERAHRACQRRARRRSRRSRTPPAQIASSMRDTKIKKAGYQAEVDPANQTRRSRDRSPRRRRARRWSRRRPRSPSCRRSRRSSSSRSTCAGRPTPRRTGRRRSPRPAATSRIRQAEAEAQEVRLRAEADAAATKVQAEAQAGTRPGSTARPRPTRSGQGPRRGRRDPRPHGGRGGRHRAARRRAEPEPGGGHRAADRREAAGDRAGRRVAVRARRQLHGPERRPGRHRRAGRDHPAGRRAVRRWRGRR